VSVVSLGEIERGIAKQERTDPGHAAALVMWLEGLVTEYSDRVLSVDVPVARRWGRLSASLGHDGADLVIAATALVHGMTVATRNTRHFRATGASVVNPFESVGHAGR
jgi:predicted nucleic acid-binding protein